MKMREIQLGRQASKYTGHVALIDDQYYDLVSRYRWHVSPRNSTLYARRTWVENGRGSPQHYQFMHTLITDWDQVDHMDHNGLHNYLSNMREASDAQNSQNRRKPVNGLTSMFKGVSWVPSRGKWVAQIGSSPRRTLGLFGSEVDAALAYDATAREMFGAFACLNFPNPGEQPAM